MAFLNLVLLGLKAISLFLGLDRLFSSFKASKVNANEQKAAAAAPITPQETLTTLDKGEL